VTVDEWVEAYRVAWEARDAEAAAALFTEDSEYRTQPFLDPYQGQEGVGEYWAQVTSTQSDVSVRMGRPFVDGDRVTVEFWTEMENDGAEITLAGCLLLRFAPDGRCARLREYWSFEPGRQGPHAGWGE
jgi:ketosteroid isomerase-like protein